MPQVVSFNLDQNWVVSRRLPGKCLFMWDIRIARAAAVAFAIDDFGVFGGGKI
jgi:hypothetical protein